MHVAHNTCRNACILSAKNAHALVHARLFNGTEASLPWKLLRTYLESCTSIMQAVVCRPPCLLSRRNLSPDAVRSRSPSKSTLAHDAVAAVVSHKHHSIIHVGAGLIQFVYGSHLRLAAGFTPSKVLFSPSFRTSFFIHMFMCTHTHVSIYIYIHTCIYVYIHIHIYIYCIYTILCPVRRKCIYLYMYTYPSAYIYYIYIYTCIPVYIPCYSLYVTTQCTHGNFGCIASRLNPTFFSITAFGLQCETCKDQEKCGQVIR